jgi:hypothetical protein
MGLENFFAKHNNVGDPHPEQTRDQVVKRRELLQGHRARQQSRKAKLAVADTCLEEAVNAIMALPVQEDPA